MNSTQYGYHPYPSPSQQHSSPPPQPHHNQLSPHPSPSSSSPEHHHSPNTHPNPTSSDHVNPTQAQSPTIDADGELVLTATSASQGQNSQSQSQQNQGQSVSGATSNSLQSQNHGQPGQPSSLLPMPSPALAAATAANTAANTNPSVSRQLILQNYQQQQQQQQQQQHLAMGMSLPVQSGSIMAQSASSANGRNQTINTTMMGIQGGAGGYMLPSPQSSQTPTLPALPPQSADLDTILAKYASNPELLKLIIASKTEEDRRWAEEARYRMMDLIIRGENRGLGFMAGYEALGGVVGNGGNLIGMTAKRFMEEGYSHHPGFAGFSSSAQGLEGGVGSGQASVLSSTAGPNAGGMPTMYPSTQVPGAFGIGGMMHSSQMLNSAMGGTPGFGQFVDPSLARKRSVTFAGEVHGHMRSQSLSSIPSASGTGQLGAVPMLGVSGTDTFSQHPGHHPPPPHPAQAGLGSSQQYPLQHPQQHQQMHFHHHPSQAPPPQFGQYPHGFAHHGLPNLHHHSVRRTNSLSHISHTQTTVTEQRLVAGRPRNDSSSSLRVAEDDSDEDSDEDYGDHPVMGGMSSRPGSALSMNNNMGGNGETSLTLEFSDLASVSGHDHSGHGQGGQGGFNSMAGVMSSRSSASTASQRAAAAAALAGPDHKRKRKRREMQPVNKIVDSPEPHVDPYLWKNNGNTTQKKTGCKSIYYKCSNSTGGCTVNKTVTEKEGGGYVTKYRGEHLEDCIRLKKAQQAAQAAQAAHIGQSIPREQ